MSLEQLLERVEVTDEPCRELDLTIQVALDGGEPVWGQTRYTGEALPSIRRPSTNHIGGFSNDPCYPVTASIDAALALVWRVLPGWFVQLTQLTNRWEANITSADGRFLIEADKEAYAVAATPALALLAALLKAKIAEQEKA